MDLSFHQPCPDRFLVICGHPAPNSSALPLLAMLFSTLITLSPLFGLSLLCLTSASPTKHRQHQKRTKKLHLNDGIILNYALTIELLELALYDAGLSTFNQQSFLDAGYPDPFYSNVEQFRVDEQAHVAFLTEALRAVGLSPTAAQSHYSFPFTDVASWVNLASVIEDVGASAYLGLAASLIDKDYLTASVSIQGTEARHTAYLRAADGMQPVPNGFGTALPYVRHPSVMDCWVSDAFTLACNTDTGMVARIERSIQPRIGIRANIFEPNRPAIPAISASENSMLSILLRVCLPR